MKVIAFKYQSAAYITCIVLVATIVFSCKRDNHIVRNMEELNKAIASAKPGDKIVMASGDWKDAEILFEGHGTKEQPIELLAEREGAVILSGLSNLQIAGEYLTVSGLIFKNGHT